MRRYFALFLAVVITNSVISFYDDVFTARAILARRPYFGEWTVILGVLFGIAGIAIFINLVTSKMKEDLSGFTLALLKVLVCNLYIGLGYYLIFR